jgi:hypothetical protein
MSACMCMAFGRALWDDDWRQKFFADPLFACQLYEGPTARASGLRALSQRDFKVLDEQIRSIRATLGDEIMRDVANNPGLQYMLGRAMLDRDFAKALQGRAEVVAQDLFGTTVSARNATAIFQSPQFKKLNGFAKQREAMREVGLRFSMGIAHGRALFREADEVQKGTVRTRSK